MRNINWKILLNLLRQINLRIGGEEKQFQLYHYTSLDVLFSILDGDTLWASNVRFTNDEMEERLLKLDNLKEIDDYTISFCSNNDQLSQWRGYCFNGGASIKFNFEMPHTYSILSADFEQTKKYKLCEKAVLPVVYIEHSMETNELENIIACVQEAIAKQYDNLIEKSEIVPYLKNDLFCEEKELRLVFSNRNGNLSDCIRFRTLKNGVKVPYVIIKCNDIGKMLGDCQMNLEQFDDEVLRKHMLNQKPIWIDEGYNQEKIYFEMRKKITQFEERDSESKFYLPIKVFCKGHLPVEKIMIAPSYDSERIAEQVMRFCRSKYWLQNVEVIKSEIPYIKPI